MTILTNLREDAQWNSDHFNSAAYLNTHVAKYLLIPTRMPKKIGYVRVESIAGK